MPVWRERVWASSPMGRSAVKRLLTHVCVDSRLCWLTCILTHVYGAVLGFVLLWPVISPLFPHLTCPRALLICIRIFLLRKILAQVKWRFDHTYYGVAPSLCDLWGAFLHMRSWGGFLDLRSSRCGLLISLFHQSSVPAINFILGVSRENKAQIYPAWQTQAALLKGPSISYLNSDSSL